MKAKEVLKKIWNYLKQDSWHSWLVSLILVFIFIKFIFFPGLSLITGSSLPLVVVESCSMYHSDSFDSWWFRNSALYERYGIIKDDFSKYFFKNGINKGDIIVSWGRADYKKGNVIIFNAQLKYPIIHRVITKNPLGTKGDNGRTNPDQLPQEINIQESQIIGKAVFKIPALGWLKLIFFEPFKPSSERGLCK